MNEDATTPRRIALAEIGRAGGAGPTAPSLLLDDFGDALIAYDRISARALGVAAEAEPPALSRWEPGGHGGIGGGVRGDGLDAAPCCDALVVALDIDERLDAELDRVLEWALAGHGRAPLLYSIACTDGLDPVAGELGLEPLLRAGEAAGLSWGGAVLALGAGTVPPSAGEPRMGRARRHRSEAIDRLIGAVRAGRSVSEAGRLFADAARATGVPCPADAGENDLIVARCPLPAALYRFLYK